MIDKSVIWNYYLMVHSNLSMFMMNNYNSVLDNMRLSSGELGNSNNLDVTKEEKKSLNLKLNSKIALRDKEGFLLQL